MKKKKNGYELHIETAIHRLNSLRARTDGSSLKSAEEIEKGLDRLLVDLDELRKDGEKLRSQLAEHEGLQSSLQRYEEIFEFAPDGYLVIDHSLNIIEVNQALATMLEVGKELIINKPLFGVIDAKYHELFKSNLLKLSKKEKESLRFELEIKPFGDGENLPVEMVIAVRHTSGGKLKNYLLLVHNISDRKLAELSVRELAEQWQVTFDATSDAICLLNTDYCVVRSNQAMQAMFQKSAEELFGANYLTILYGTGDGRSAMKPDPQRGSMEVLIKGKWVDVRLNPVMDRSGRLMSAILLLRDITERKQVETELVEAKLLLEKIFTSLDQAVFVISTKNRMILACNPAVERIFGYTEKELIGHNTEFMYVDHMEYERYPQELTAALDANKVYHTELIMRRKDGSHFPVEITETGFLDSAGHRMGVVSVIRDITTRKNIEEILRESEKRYRRIVETAQEGIWLIDAYDKTTFVNLKMSELLGYQVEDMIGKALFDFMDEEGVAITKQNLERRRQGIQEQHDFRFLRKDGEELWVIMETGPIIGESGEYLGALAMVTDVTKRKRMEEALIASEAKFRNLMEQSPYGIVVVDEQGNVVEWNQGQELLSGLKRAEVIGMPIWDVQFVMLTDEAKLTYDLQNIRTVTLGILENGYGPDLNLTMEGEIQLPDGTRRNVEMVMYSYKTKDGYQSGCITRDVTERKMAEHRMEYLATHDELTGLPNRLLYRDRLNVAIERMQRENHDQGITSHKVTAVMLLDLDNFKFINDTYGHDEGDRTLKIVAARLNESLRRTDTVARMGGDEFLLIHENVSSVEDVISVAKKILTHLSVPIRIASFEHQITASIGISLYPLDGQNDETLLKHADIAMYRAKQTGDRFEFYNFPDDNN